MKLFDINPYVRFARVFDKSVSRREIVGLDNRLFYCESGVGEITAANEKYTLNEGAALLIRAGTPYKNTSPTEGMKLYAFNFDFLYDESRPRNAVSYVFADEYRQNMLLEPLEKFEELGVPGMVTTDDGTLGRKGFVTDALRESGCDYFLACGPTPMLRALHRTGITGQLSFEERMGCGFGACMGCTCHTLVGTKRVCKDGPVFPTEEVTFE